MNSNNLYERYHANTKLQKRIISNKNFTYRNILEAITGLKRFKRVLDVGCGTGALDFYLGKKGKKVVGVDISSRAIQTAKANAKNFGLNKNVKFFTGDIRRKLPKGKYDFVIFSEVIEHLHNGKVAIKKIHSLLNKNGILLLSTPLSTAPLYKLRVTSEHDEYAGHVHIYEENEITILIKNAGFKILKVKGAEGIFRNSLFVFPVFGFLVRVANRFETFSDLITFVDNINLKLFGSSQIIIVAKK